jgi:hypothetical protein
MELKEEHRVSRAHSKYPLGGFGAGEKGGTSWNGLSITGFFCFLRPCSSVCMYSVLAAAHTGNTENIMSMKGRPIQVLRKEVRQRKVMAAVTDFKKIKYN